MICQNVILNSLFEVKSLNPFEIYFNIKSFMNLSLKPMWQEFVIPVALPKHHSAIFLASRARHCGLFIPWSEPKLCSKPGIQYMFMTMAVLSHDLLLQKLLPIGTNPLSLLQKNVVNQMLWSYPCFLFFALTSRCFPSLSPNLYPWQSYFYVLSFLWDASWPSLFTSRYHAGFIFSLRKARM